MGAPNIMISFIEKAKTVEDRGKQGIVLLLVKDTLPAILKNPITISSEKDIPSSISEDTKEQIKLAMIGYERKPKKVLVYCMSITEGAEKEELDKKYQEAKEALEVIKFDYLAVPTVETDEKGDEIAAWVKEMREKKKRKIKAILPNVAADNEGVINYSMKETIGTKEKILANGSTTQEEVVYTAEQYCSRIAGLIAGTPITMSCTYAPLTELRDCSRINEIDASVDKGELILFFDGEKIKVVRGINSLITITEGKGESYKKIKVVDTMDMIQGDITTLIQDNYIGKYANTYENKGVLLAALEAYFKELIKQDIISDYTIDIDVEGQEEYLKSKGIDTSELEEKEIKKAYTGTNVFLIGTINILDAMEDLTLKFYM